MTRHAPPSIRADILEKRVLRRIRRTAQIQVRKPSAPVHKFLIDGNKRPPPIRRQQARSGQYHQTNRQKDSHPQFGPGTMLQLKFHILTTSQEQFLTFPTKRSGRRERPIWPDSGQVVTVAQCSRGEFLLTVQLLDIKTHT